MLRHSLLLIVFLALVGTNSFGQGAPKWSQDQRDVLDTMDRLSATTAPDGLGAAAYAAILAEDYNRWTSGSTSLSSKKAWVEGIGEWLGDGWRVVDSQRTVVGVTIKGDFAFSRRIVEETYLSPEGETSKSKAALVEIWIYQKDRWLLLQTNVDVL